VPDERRRVLITGAAGRIGRAIAPLLPGDWLVRRTDRFAADGIEALEITDLDVCRAAFAGMDAVVHLAANPTPDATWDQLVSPNVVGPYTVAQAAADCGVRRLVLASSMHAVSGIDQNVQVRTDDQARPGNLYGATKAWAEAIGAWVATSSATTVVALRIGYFAEEFPDPVSTPVGNRTAWLSPRDAADLVRSAVLADGIDFFVAYGISANQHRRADLSTTIHRLSYQPQDDAWATEQ
jgi:nucleoside-diphosphate-sugar epimerase